MQVDRGAGLGLDEQVICARSPMGTIDALEFLSDKMRTAKTNAEFWDSMN